MKEHIAIAEARKLNIPTFAIVDTNSDPNLVDFPIPANADASKSIALVVKKVVEAIEEGLNERKFDREKRASDEDHEELDENGVRINIEDIDEDETDADREAARKKRVADGEECSEERAKRPRKVVARKPGGGAPRKPRP